jgi:hypothetical protein
MTRSSVTAAVLLAPALAFIAGAGLNSAGLPSGPSGQALLADLNQIEAWSLLSPVLFLGGAFVALAVTTAAQLRLNVALQFGSLHATASPHLRPEPMLLAALSIAVLAVLTSYALAENWRCLTGERLAC